MREQPLMIDIPEVPTLSRLVRQATALARLLDREPNLILDPPGVTRITPSRVVLTEPRRRTEYALTFLRAKKRAAKAMRARQGRAHDRAGRPL